MQDYGKEKNHKDHYLRKSQHDHRINVPPLRLLYTPQHKTGIVEGQATINKLFYRVQVALVSLA
jgi:hypothetical protein